MQMRQRSSGAYRRKLVSYIHLASLTACRPRNAYAMCTVFAYRAPIVLCTIFLGTMRKRDRAANISSTMLPAARPLVRETCLANSKTIYQSLEHQRPVARPSAVRCLRGNPYAMGYALDMRFGPLYAASDPRLCLADVTAVRSVALARGLKCFT